MGFIVLSICLVLFGVFSFFLVHASNQTLSRSLALVSHTQVLVAPAGSVALSLERLLPALFGSLFITLTAGIALSAFVCLALLLFFSPRIMPCHLPPLGIPLFLAGALLCGLIYFAMPDSGQISRARDYLLLSNRPGTWLNNFYYRFSPYAAQALNPPLKKQVKPCWIDPKIFPDPILKTLLLKSGWIALSQPVPESLIIELSPGFDLVFKQGEKTILSVAESLFLENPLFYLKEFSKKTDPHHLLRSLSSVGLFGVLPLAGLALCFSSLYWIFRCWMAQKPSVYLSAFSMVLLVLSGFLYLNPLIITSSEIPAITRALASPASRIRTEALRALYKKGGTLDQIPEYLNRPLDKRSIPEKLWLAKVLARPGRRHSNITYLRPLLTDKALNVRFNALRAMSALGCSQISLDLFRKVAQTSPLWYEQIIAVNDYRSCL